ncbi:MAG: D-alanyl-D-alanine carboxypeptidase family protein [Bacillota bacterium]
MHVRWPAAFLTAAVLVFTALAFAPPAGASPAQGEVVSQSFDGHVLDPESLEASSAILLDIRTGALLFEKAPDEPYGPASLAKIVTLALTYAAIEQGRVAPDDLVLVSEKAWSANVPGSKMFIEVGEQIELGTLMTGMIVASGNDACIAVAEHLAGSEEVFVGRMNDLVQQLGMEETVLGTVHGLPAEGQRTTPRDVARLVRFFTLTYPQAEDITRQESFTYATITQSNRNGLLFRDERVTGLKTGYTRESGYHLVATAREGEEYYAAIVMGVAAGEDLPENVAAPIREADAQLLLDWAFDTFDRSAVKTDDALPEEVRVYGGRERTVGIRTGEEPEVTVLAGTEDQIRVEVSVEESPVAPLSRDAVIGTLRVYWEPPEESDGAESVHLGEWNLYPAEEVERGSWWRRLVDGILLFFQRLRQ